MNRSRAELYRSVVKEEQAKSKLLRELGRENAELRARLSWPILCICGSTRFRSLWISETARLTLEGNIVLPVGVFGYYIKDSLTVETKVMLCRQHRAKILLSDWVWVLNPNGYIGEGTAAQIEYAQELGRPVRYFWTEFPDYQGPLE